MTSFVSIGTSKRRNAPFALPGRAAVLSSVAALFLLSACGGDGSSPGSSAGVTSSATASGASSAPKPIAPEVTSATVQVDQNSQGNQGNQATQQALTPLPADQPYVDNTLYDASPTASLPTATEAAAVTHHRIKLNGVNMTYTATAGHLIVRDPNTNAAQASIFYTAYTLDNQNTTRRPVTVFFNGGPGSPSSFLHMGSFGPMRVFTAQGSTVSGPNDVTLGENPQTLLDKSDLIFVDPVGTGYSEAIAPSKNQDFWGVNPDVNIMAGFINRYMITNNRGNSPLMVYGESYGGPRAGILSYALQDQYGIKLSGLMMQAPALNFYEGEPARRDPLPPFLLPTITMAAKYYGKITDPSLAQLSEADLFQASENFTFNDLRSVTPNPYNSVPTAAQYAKAGTLVARLQALTGNTPVIYNNATQGDTPVSSATDVLAAVTGWLDATGMIAGQTLGYYDLRKQLAGNLAKVFPMPNSYLTYDPSLNDLAAYTPIFASYAYNTLKYQTPSLYHGLTGTIADAWDHNTTYPDGSKLAFPDATIFIADEMMINPHMQVLTSAGYYDSVVPAAQVDWDMQSVAQAVPTQQMAQMYTRILYPAGHMGYADDPTRKLLRNALSTFYDKAVKTSVASMK
ncbi:Carboxypeptidase C (cathepsin A) [Burkholderia singularis]|uniref:Carboxypeptidase C (Cathepsin A) n=1 Tax=Burkholderia singularis TaxID=1503053 RepID=A0A238H693_9BURK|nr:Carboxypeptidase C (cathepsin A) [Burkholderia singularis]